MAAPAAPPHVERRRSRCARQRTGPALGSLPALLLLLAAPAASGIDLATCGDPQACEARLRTVTERLQAIGAEIGGKKATLSTLEQLRRSILEGRRTEIHSVQRKHLEKGGPLIDELTYDLRHRPISTNSSRLFKHKTTAAPGAEVRLHTFASLRNPGEGGDAFLVNSVLMGITAEAGLNVHSVDGDELLSNFDLGHEGVAVQFLATAVVAKEGPIVVTADEVGHIRVHTFRVKTSVDLWTLGFPHSAEMAIANFSCSFEASMADPFGEAVQVTAVEVIEWASQAHYLVGDSRGGVSVFLCTGGRGYLKARVRITEDPGGIRGFIKSLLTPLMVYSAHSCGQFSLTSCDLEYPMCSGWSSPIEHIVMDISYSTSRLFLSLENGEVLVVNTARGQNKACDLAAKFPHVSAVPLRLHAFPGYMLGMPMSRGETEHSAEVLAFSLSALDSGFGVAPTRIVYAQASISDRRPVGFSVWRGKPFQKLAVRFAGARGIEIFDVSLRRARASKVASAEGTSEDEALGMWATNVQILTFCLPTSALVAWVLWKNFAESTPSSRTPSASREAAEKQRSDMEKKVEQAKAVQRRRADLAAGQRPREGAAAAAAASERG